VDEKRWKRWVFFLFFLTHTESNTASSEEIEAAAHTHRRERERDNSEKKIPTLSFEKKKIGGICTVEELKKRPSISFSFWRLMDEGGICWKVFFSSFSCYLPPASLGSSKIYLS
jgi:hypothetical protein